MGDLTLTQRVLGPVINAMVERFFPRGIFYGEEYLKIFGEEGWEHMGPTGSAAFFVISTVRENNATEGTFTFEGVTARGAKVGDWRMVVEEMKSAKEPS